MRESGASWEQKKLFSETIIDKLFETNSSFLVGWRTAGRGGAFLFLREFLLALAGGGLGTGQ